MTPIHWRFLKKSDYLSLGLPTGGCVMNETISALRGPTLRLALLGTGAGSTSRHDGLVAGRQIFPLAAALVSLSENAVSVPGDSSVIEPFSTTTTMPATATSDSFLRTDSASAGTGRSSPAALNMTPFASSTLASAGANALPLLALSLLLALAGLGLRRGAGRRGLLIQ
jgi:hypothetical protein